MSWQFPAGFVLGAVAYHFTIIFLFFWDHYSAERRSRGGEK